MDKQSISLLIVSLINFILGLMIISTGQKKRTNFAFSLVVWAVVAWTLSMFGYRFFQDQTAALAMCRLLYVAAISIPLLFLCFTFIFPEGKKGLGRLRAFLLHLPAFILIILTIFTDTIIADVIIRPGQEHKIVFGQLYVFYAIFITGYFGWSFYNLAGDYFRSADESKRQIFFVFIGAFLASLIAMATNLFLPWFDYFKFNWFGQLATALWIAFTAYAITRYHLMNIKVVATELFAALLVVTSFIEVFFAVSWDDAMIKTVIFIITLFFATLLIRSVLNEVKRREEMEVLNKKLNKATKELAAANKELKRLDESKSEFLSISSHQLRTPLTIIKGYSSMLLEGSFGKMAKPVKESIDKIYVSTERLINLVESLLNISRIEAGRIEFKIEAVDLAEVAKSMVADFQDKAKARGLKLELSVEEKVPPVAADAQKIKDIVSNIIDNAIKYTKQGEIMVGLHQEGQSVVFASQDTGIGLEAEEIGRLFNKFTRGKDSAKVNTEGTGLGLYYARVLVENMGGRIWVESPGKGKGSKFCFSLPLFDKKLAKKIQ